MKKDIFILRDGEFLLTKTGKVRKFSDAKSARKYLLKSGVKSEEVDKKFSIVHY